MNGQAWAILWAQWRALRNMYPRSGRAGAAFGLVISLLWYAVWTVGAAAVALVVMDTGDVQTLERFLAPGLLLGFLYWQIIPVLMVTSGASLQMRRLRVYPIPHSRMFGLEVLLRMTTAWEMILLLAGASAGLLLNPKTPVWWGLAFIPYLVFNLCMSAGVRDLITRMLAGKRFREGLVFVLVALATLPQLALRNGVPDARPEWLDFAPAVLWPWAATARLVTGHWDWRNLSAALAWMVAAYAFGRWQFERGLRFDEEAARAQGNGGAGVQGWTETLFRLPGRLFRDPIAAVVEKELRSLCRSPRFRIVFVMGFSFGLLVWLPMAFGQTNKGFMQTYFLVIVSAYAMMLLSEVTIWNVLGFDRSAAQLYWLAPVRIVQMLVAKNIATAIFVVLEILIITAVCLLFRMPVTFPMFAEALTSCVVLLVFLLALGNYSSLRFPRPVDPNQNWKRSSASRFQAMLLFVYPVLAMPFAFAYFAKYMWESAAAFYGVVGVTACVAAAAYGFSLESAGEAASEGRERILSLLGQGEGPVAS